eukprot:251888-Prorocentrum_minimum.AAC.1
MERYEPLSGESGGRVCFAAQGGGAAAGGGVGGGGERRAVPFRVGSGAALPLQPGAQGQGAVAGGVPPAALRCRGEQPGVLRPHPLRRAHHRSAGQLSPPPPSPRPRLRTLVLLYYCHRS